MSELDNSQKIELPKYLYHYTNAEGLIGIFEKKKIWASNLYFMNDSSELELTKTLFTEVIKKQNRIPNKEQERLFLSYINQYFRFKICSFSLCEEGNLLSQWQGYADHINGYSIGFKVDELKKHETVTKRLYKCIYDRKLQEAIINEFIDEIEIDKLLKVDGLHGWMKAINTTIKMLKYAPIIKNYHFESEREWRLVIKEFDNDDENYKFRSRNGILPYYEIDISSNFYKLIDHIYIGPCTDSLRTQIGLVELLEKYKFSNIEKIIRVSEIPYRGKS